MIIYSTVSITFQFFVVRVALQKCWEFILNDLKLPVQYDKITVLDGNHNIVALLSYIIITIRYIFYKNNKGLCEKRNKQIFVFVCYTVCHTVYFFYSLLFFLCTVFPDSWLFTKLSLKIYLIIFFQVHSYVPMFYRQCGLFNISPVNRLSCLSFFLLTVFLSTTSIFPVYNLSFQPPILSTTCPVSCLSCQLSALFTVCPVNCLSYWLSVLSAICHV